MKKIILLSIFSIQFSCCAMEPEKTLTLPCARAINAHLGSTEKGVMRMIGITPSLAYAPLTESEIRERVNNACLRYNGRHRVTVISPALAQHTADSIIAIGVPAQKAKL